MIIVQAYFKNHFISSSVIMLLNLRSFLVSKNKWSQNSTKLSHIMLLWLLGFFFFFFLLRKSVTLH